MAHPDDEHIHENGLQPEDQDEQELPHNDIENGEDEDSDEAQIPRKTREHSRSGSRSSSSSSRNKQGSGSSSGRSRSSSSGSSSRTANDNARSGQNTSKLTYSSAVTGSGRRKRSSSSSSNSIKTRSLNVALLLIRVSVSVSMLTHGMKHFDMLISSQSQAFLDPIGLGQAQSLFLAVFAEVFCSILIIVGLFTRFATLPLMITMLVAALAVHLEEGFEKMELPLFYFMFYFLFLVTGPGKYSLDRYIKKLRKERFQ